MKENSIVFYRVFDRLYDEQSCWSLYIDFSNIIKSKRTNISYRLERRFYNKILSRKSTNLK